MILIIIDEIILKINTISIIKVKKWYLKFEINV